MSEKVDGYEVLADVIRRHYDLGAVYGVEHLREAHQRRHRKLVAETSAGKFLVKTYKRDPVILDALRFQHRLSDHLLNNRLPVAGIVRVLLFNQLGQEVRELVNGFRDAGSYEITLDAAGLPSGVYFYRMESGPFVDAKKVVLLR